MMSLFFNYNGKILRDGTAIASPGSRGLRYGDGLFETMRVSGSKILLKDLHFSRLFEGLKVLQFIYPSSFTSLQLEKQVLALCSINKIPGDARVRIIIFRGEGGLYDPENHIINYAIEAWPLSVSGQLNSNGLVIDVYEDVKKSCDILSNLKSNNYLPYVLASLFAKNHKLNDVLILNNYNRICDTTIANIFAISGNTIVTPALSEGCVSGVMRQWLLMVLPAHGYSVIEKAITLKELKQAEGIFLSNAIQGIRWVGSCSGIAYSDKQVRKVFEIVANAMITM